MVRMLENICEILSKVWRFMQKFGCNRKPYGKVGRLEFRGIFILCDDRGGR